MASCSYIYSASIYKHHQHKLQLVTTTTCASGMVAPVERSARCKGQGARCKGQGARCKDQASISASRYGMQQQHASTTATTSDRIGPAQHDAAISATIDKGK